MNNRKTPTPLRIALLSPRGPLYRHRTGLMKKSLRYQPLTLTTLASLVPEELRAEVVLFDEGFEEIPGDLQADLIGISAITGTATRAYELADQFRRRGIPVVLGGVHPTLMPEEAAEHADAVVTGYAERSWPQLLRDFAAGRMQPRYRQEDDFSLAGLRPARRDMLSAGRYKAFHTIEATRGCTHQCEFCVVPTAWGGHFAYTLFVECRDVSEYTLHRIGSDLEEGLLENYHYRYCRDLGQLDPVRVFRIRVGGREAYLEHCRSLGQRLGDIKPSALHRRSGWTLVFQGDWLRKPD
jgi:hypothetical protein